MSLRTQLCERPQRRPPEEHLILPRNKIAGEVPARASLTVQAQSIPWVGTVDDSSVRNLAGPNSLDVSSKGQAKISSCQGN